MQVLQRKLFARQFKKLHANQRGDVEKAIRALMADPLAGDMKTADLAGVRVYKFRMVKKLTLLAYEYDEAQNRIILDALGSHENFYRDLTKHRK